MTKPNPTFAQQPQSVADGSIVSTKALRLAATPATQRTRKCVMNIRDGLGLDEQTESGTTHDILVTKLKSAQLHINLDGR
jgi:hypothetical protein